MEREKALSFLTGFRKVVLRSLAAVAVAAIVSFIYARDIMKLLLKTAGIKIYFFSLPEVFLTALQLALYGGIFFALPLIIYLAWREIRNLVGTRPVYGYAFILSAIVLFYGGSLFCYRFVLPSGIGFLISYEGGAVKAMISVERFVVFCSAMIFAFGATFEVPIVMLILAKMGIVKSRMLSKTRRFAILFIAIAAAIITPTPDVYNMMLLAVPMYVLYEAGIVLVKLTERSRGRADR
ncbi:MAG TPA: twin-arginine translocase subunit TatC [Syntrophorhabdaceae bacterium]|nr:twin-arginine translocase subunit TatC [Syntrophorhabdaceae bacterium]